MKNHFVSNFGHFVTILPWGTGNVNLESKIRSDYFRHIDMRCFSTDICSLDSCPFSSEKFLFTFTKEIPLSPPSPLGEGRGVRL